MLMELANIFLLLWLGMFRLFEVYLEIFNVSQNAHVQMGFLNRSFLAADTTDRNIIFVMCSHKLLNLRISNGRHYLP